MGCKCYIAELINGMLREAEIELPQGQKVGAGPLRLVANTNWIREFAESSYIECF